MFDQRSAHGPGTQVQRARAAGTPGKTTLTEQLNGGPEATAAGHHKRKGLLQALHEVLHKAADKIKEKISDKVKEAPEKLLEKLLAKLEKAAELRRSGRGPRARRDRAVVRLVPRAN